MAANPLFFWLLNTRKMLFVINICSLRAQAFSALLVPSVFVRRRDRDQELHQRLTWH